MKPTTKQICDILEKPELLEWYAKLKETNGNHSHEETTIEEGYEEFVRFKDLILGTAQKNLFDKISFKKRQTVLTAITNIDANLTHCQQYAYNIQSCVQQINTTIMQTFAVVAILEEVNLYLKSLGISSKRKLTAKLTDTLDEYQKIVEEISSKKGLMEALGPIDESVQQVQKDVIESQENIANLKESADDSISEITSILENTKKLFQNVTKINEDAKKLLESIKEYEEDAETKRLGINTFSQNIEEYKTTITGLENRAKAIVAKETIIKGLIQSAEEALNLKSAEGISAAFATQYNTANSRFVLGGWILGATVCILGAIFITIWIASGKIDIDSHGISLITARIVAVAITVTGATFCAKQYIKQKNIAEDYAYKAVLAKSIIAFADKLKEKGDENSDIVAEYLKKVLDEIHQDPLRQRNIKDESVPATTTSEMLSQLWQFAKESMDKK